MPSQRRFQPDKPLFRLTPEPVKLAIFQRLGLAGVFVKQFNAALAALSADEFVQLLARELQVAGVVIGHDFHFGRGREGNPERMAELCLKHGLECHHRACGRRRLRAGLVQRDPRRSRSGRHRHRQPASRLSLVRPRRGASTGTSAGATLGYPTANMRLPDDCRLRHGIYAVRASVGGKLVDGVASFGRRPTFDNGAPLLEVHLFDFSGDLYGQIMDVEFIGWIRGEEKFDDIEALIAQMDRDSVEAKRMLAEDRTASMIG